VNTDYNYLSDFMDGVTQGLPTKATQWMAVIYFPMKFA
jgi:hypothetical protein